MTDKATALVKISKAEQATDQIQAHVGTALHELGKFNGRIIDGHGTYVDISRQRQALSKAKTAIDAAMQTMLETPWPSERDYDAADS